MSVWVDNAWNTLIYGFIVFLIAFIPGLIWQYRRWGGFSMTRMLGWAAVCIYFAGLFVYTLLPLPANSDYCAAGQGAGHNFNPLAALSDVREHTAGMGLVQALKSTVVLQLVFNVVLFVPFGVVLRRYFGRGILLTTALGFLTSLFIETTQYTGLLGLYDCAYRVADVDDVILNTTGALIGAIIAPALLFWMPQANTLSARRAQPRPVTVWRRWLGMFLDFLAWNAVLVVIEVGVQALRTYGFGQDAAHAPWWQHVAGVVAATIFVFILPAAEGRGASMGQSIVWITPKWLDPHANKLTNATAPRRIGRALIMSGVLSLSELTAIMPPGVDNAVNAATGAVLLAAVVMVPLTRTKRSLSGLLSGAYFVDARDPRAGGIEDGVSPLLSRVDLAEMGITAQRNGVP